MQKLTILNTREIKKIRELMEAMFGYALDGDYVYLQNEKDRLFLTNRDFAKIDTKKLILDRVGLYFAEYKNNDLRLSKEGAQLLFHHAQKAKVKLNNTVELPEDQVKKYFLGYDLERDLGPRAHYVLLMYNQEVFSCTKYKEGKILNFHPKQHRGEVIT